MTMTTRKRHSPEQVVRKLATADRMLGEGKDVADVCRPGRGLAEVATSVRQGPPAARIPTGVPRCPRRGLDRQPQEDPTALARRGPTCAATTATQTPGHQHRTRPAEGRRAQPRLG